MDVVLRKGVYDLRAAGGPAGEASTPSPCVGKFAGTSTRPRDVGDLTAASVELIAHGKLGAFRMHAPFPEVAVPQVGQCARCRSVCVMRYAICLSLCLMFCGLAFSQCSTLTVTGTVNAGQTVAISVSGAPAQ